MSALTAKPAAGEMLISHTQPAGLELSHPPLGALPREEEGLLGPSREGSARRINVRFLDKPLQEGRPCVQELEILKNKVSARAFIQARDG